MLSSRSYFALLLLGWGYSTGSLLLAATPPAERSPLLQAGPDPNWLRPSRGHLHISFHKAHDFWSTMWLLPLIYTGTSCSEKSLIDGSVKAQYETKYEFISFFYHQGSSEKPFCFVFNTLENILHFRVIKISLLKIHTFLPVKYMSAISSEKKWFNYWIF